MPRKYKRSINVVIHGAPIQATPFVNLPFNLRESIKALIKSGIIYVAPAGNYGPLPGTINPFAKFKNAIIVGGAKNDGSDLCSFSSRGIPGLDNYYEPTIVCPCEDLIGKTHSAIDPVIESSKKKQHLFTKEKYEKQVRTKVTDEQWEIVKERYVIGTGTSQAVEYLVNIIFWIIYFRNQRNFVSDQRVIRKLLTNMAIPIKKYKSHEIGAGFVNYEIADEYLKKIENGNIPSNEKEIWSRIYYSSKAKSGKIVINWADNINDPNQIDYTNGEDTFGDSRDSLGIGDVI